MKVNIQKHRQSIAPQNIGQVELLDVEESWVTDDQIWIRHPWARIFTSLFIILCDFVMFGEDPLADSETEASLPFFGNVLTMALSKYPESGGQSFFKAFLVFLSIPIGIATGTWVHHRIFRDKLRINMFSEDKGTWPFIGLCWAIVLYIFSELYNATLPDDVEKITSAMGLTNRQYGKFAQCCTWLGDLITVVMVWDSMFQDREKHPEWVSKFKDVWNFGCHGYFRVVAVWIGVVATTSGVFAAIWMAGNGETISWNEDSFYFTTEIGRICLVSVIVMVDLCIVFQDWEFPTFDDSNADIMVAGTFDVELSCNCLDRCLRRLRECSCVRWLIDSQFFQIVVTGKWLNYGPLFVIICLDLNMMKNQIIYDPVDFGQYVDPNDYIWTIVDHDYLDLAYEDGAVMHPEMISWDVRRGAINITASALTDKKSNTKWRDATMGEKGACGIIGILALLCFFFLVYWSNQNEAQLKEREEARKRAKLAKDLGSNGGGDIEMERKQSSKQRQISIQANNPLHNHQTQPTSSYDVNEYDTDEILSTRQTIVVDNSDKRIKDDDDDDSNFQ